METFTEVQQNRYRWYILAFAFVLPTLIFGWFSDTVFDLLKDDMWIPLVGFCGYTLFTTGFVYITVFRKIITQIDQNSIRFRVTPFGQWLTISWADIDRAYIREFTLYGEYPRGLGGFRQGPNGWAYVIDGTYGLQIDKKSGGKILLGTQRPDELRGFLNSLPTAPTAQIVHRPSSANPAPPEPR